MSGNPPGGAGGEGEGEGEGEGLHGGGGAKEEGGGKGCSAQGHPLALPHLLSSSLCLWGLLT